MLRPALRVLGRLGEGGARGEKKDGGDSHGRTSWAWLYTTACCARVSATAPPSGRTRPAALDCRREPPAPGPCPSSVARGDRLRRSSQSRRGTRATAALPHRRPRPSGLDGQPDPRPDAAFVDVVRKECAACHVLPAPGDVPRGLWRQRLQDMKRFSLTRIGVPPGSESALATLDLEPFVAYFEARAPETLPSPEPWPAPDPGRFERRLLSPPGAAPVPIVANTRFLDLDGDGKLEIVACDMGHGLVLFGDPARRPGELREIAKVPNPVHAAAVGPRPRRPRRTCWSPTSASSCPRTTRRAAVVWLRAPGRRHLREARPRREAAARDGRGGGRLRRRRRPRPRGRRLRPLHPRRDPAPREPDHRLEGAAVRPDDPRRADGRHPRADRRPRRRRATRTSWRSSRSSTRRSWPS